MMSEEWPKTQVLARWECEHELKTTCPYCEIERYRKALEAIKTTESKGQARRIAIQGLGA